MTIRSYAEGMKTSTEEDSEVVHHQTLLQKAIFV